MYDSCLNVDIYFMFDQERYAYIRMNEETGWLKGEKIVYRTRK